MPDTRVHVVAVRGHESGDGAALRDLAGPDTAVVTGGRELYRALAARPPGQDTAVVPMTLGRDPELVADVARTVRSLPAELRGAVAVTEPFGSSEHLIGWLRAAASTVPAEAALLITAPTGDPYQDAELYRVAHLVRRYGRHRLVEVALIDGDPDPAEGAARCARLGAQQVAVLPAWFGATALPPAPAGVRPAETGPLLGPAGFGAVLATRVAAAVRLLHEHGDDGVARALGAADGQGLNHTHGPGADHHHGHGPDGDHHHHHGSAEGHHHSHGPDGDHHHHHGSGESHHAHSPFAQHTPSPSARSVSPAGTRSHP